MAVEQGSRSGSDYRALTGFVVGRQHVEPGIKGSDEDRSAERSNVRQFDMLDDHRLVSCSFCDKSWCVNLKKAASSWDSSILAELVNSWAVASDRTSEEAISGGRGALVARCSIWTKSAIVCASNGCSRWSVSSSPGVKATAVWSITGRPRMVPVVVAATQ